MWRQATQDRINRRSVLCRGGSILLTALMGAALLGAKAHDPVRKLRQAHDYWEHGAHKKALKRLTDLRGGELDAHIELLRARLLNETGELDAALEAAQAALDASPPTELRARIQQEIARIHLTQGDLLSAYRAQRSAWETTQDTDYAASLAEELALAFEQNGLPGDALQLYHTTWQSWPLAERSEWAFKRALLLTEATGAPPPAPAHLLAWAERLREAARCGTALPVLEAVLTTSKLRKRLRDSAERGRANCLFQLRRYNEAAAAYEELKRKDPKDTKVAIKLARSLARAGHAERAVQQLEAVARRSDKKTLARVRYLLALLLPEEKEALAKKLLRAVQKQRAVPGLARLARWRLAWAELRAEKYQAAIRRLTPLTRGSQWDIEVQRARYWVAMAKLQIDPKQGRAQLAELAQDLPLSYYGLLAATHLEAPPAIERSFVGERGDERSYPSLRRARWLLEAGFDDSARYELNSWVRSATLERAGRLAAARLLHALGEHLQAVRLVVNGFGGALEQGIDPEWREAWNLAWPRPFDTSVRQAAEEFESDPALTYAVMREESTYRAQARSPAGALGLMQIIPPTANRIAQSLGLDPFEPESLFNPETNIRFGTYYLKQLLSRFDGSSPLAIAAYNAGPDIVSSWRTRDGALAHDVFVESVPYGETRRYLRRVLRSYQVYRLLYGPSEPPGSPQSQTRLNR